MKIKETFKAVRRTVLPLVAGLVFLACVVAVIAWMAGVFEEKIQADDAAPAEARGTPASDEEKQNAYEVKEIYKPYIEEAVGTLKAASRTAISSRVMARIEKIEVRAFDSVEENDVLIRLDPRTLNAELSQAEAALAEIQAAKNGADSEYRRTAQAYQKNATSRATFEKAAENVNVFHAKLEHAKQVVRGAQVRLSYTEITAPKRGVVVDRLAEEGNMAQPGQPLLVLYDRKSLRLEVPVMENLAVNLEPGDKLDVYIDARDRQIKATVDEIVPQAEAASRSFLVKVSLPQSEDLFEGLFGRLRIPVGKRRHLCLHTGTIQTVGQLQFVEVIRPDGIKQRRMIKTGRLGDPNHREVLSGLIAKELVVMKRADPGGGQPFAGEPDPAGQP